MHAAIQNLIQLRDEAGNLLDQAQNLGMDVDGGRFFLQDYRRNFLLLRTVSHALEKSEFDTLVEEAKGQAGQALHAGQKAIEEFHYRRKGLLVALLLSLPVILFLWLKIRALDRTRPQ